ncbi:hypothetical protein D1007_37245 [Hordeum vulgare]|nr:hypothetical protein D1007_37245 [Hordeum vulgare]
MVNRRGGSSGPRVTSPTKAAAQKANSGGVCKTISVVAKESVPAPSPTKSTASTTTSSQVQSSKALEVEVEQPLDPRYKDMICFNCGGPSHYVGSCVIPKSCFIYQQNHNYNNCAAWSKIQPTAAVFGSGARGLGFYHVDVPLANEYNSLNFHNYVVVNITKDDVDRALLLILLTNTFCNSKQWPWQIMEISHKTFLVRFPPWKKVEDLIELSGFCLPQDVVVKMTEWKGACDPFGELVEAWVLIEGIPPKWCTWKVFSQVASMFGFLTDVDWNGMFRTFFEHVRVKIACRDPTKIPFERFIEMKRTLFLMGFTVEDFEQVGGLDSIIDIVSQDEDGDAGGAEEDGEDKDEPSKDEMHDDLVDGETAIDQLDKSNIPGQRNYGSAGKSKTSVFGPSSNADHESFIMEVATGRGFSQQKHGCGEGSLDRVTTHEIGPSPNVIIGENNKLGVYTPVNLGPECWKNMRIRNIVNHYQNLLIWLIIGMRWTQKRM